jgi:trehalose-6-phosphatase
MEDTQFHWKQIHRITASQEPLGHNEKSSANIPKKAKTVYPKEKAVEIRLSSTVKGTAEIYIYAARKDDGVVEVASGVVRAGNQTIERDNQLCYCVDFISVKNHWLSKIKIASLANSWARIMFATHGYHRVFVRVKFSTGQWYVDMVGADL